MKILVVEDDDNLRTGLCDNLRDEGFTVTAAANGEEAMRALAMRVDLIVLDVMLPDTNGYDLCRRLRAKGDGTMVLMLTARTLEEDVVRGLEAGADDYVAKPYRLKELLARIQALVRRAGVRASGETTAFAGFVLDRKARVLSRDGKPIDLTRTEFDLLALFLSRKGDALPRQEILDRVWGEDLVVDPRTIDNFVSSLKKKLAWSERAGWRVSTVRGVGYRFDVG